MNENVITNLLDARVNEDGERPFVWCEGERLTFADMQARSDQVAAGLDQIGVRQGDRVALLTPNRVEMLELYFAVARIGATQVPLNAFLKGEFLRYQLDDAQATTLVTDEAGYRAVLPLLSDLPDLVRLIVLDDHAVQTDHAVDVIPYGDLRACSSAPPRPMLTPDDLMSIVYTSGTTGLPKGCMLSHGYYVRVARCGVDFFGLQQDDVHLTAMPMFHAAARLLVVGSALCVGNSVAIMSEFSPSRVLDLAVELGVTVWGGVGAMGAALLNTPASHKDLAHQIRLAWFVPMSVEMQDAMKERFDIPDIMTELYGQTECFPVVFNHLNGEREPASDGAAANDLEVLLVDDDGIEVPVGEPGEITLRPRHRHAMFDGYWRKPEATLEAFRGLWYHTGDFGRRDERGFVSFVDRKRDALRRRGENVSSVELESAIITHPNIAEAAVHAVPSALTEDDIKACIVLGDGVELTPEAAFEFFRSTLPYFAIPRFVEILDELPRNAVERVMKHLLRDRGVTAETWDFEALGFSVTRSERR
jgi:crotonobetaine/carnitine-CoA ligase